VVDRDGDAGSPAWGREPGEPVEQSGSQAAEDDASDPIGQVHLALRSGFGDVVEEPGNEQRAVDYPRVDEGLVDAAEVRLIVDRQGAERPGLVLREHGRKDRVAFVRNRGGERANSLDNPVDQASNASRRPVLARVRDRAGCGWGRRHGVNRGRWGCK
jgi:hypothetical protein